MSIHKEGDGVYKIRWREGGRNRSLSVHGSHELAKKILRKKLSCRDENRHLDVKKEINFRMSALIDRYWVQCASKKKSQDREKSVLEGIRDRLGTLFVREADGTAIDGWYRSLLAEKGSEGTAARHFNVMHHMMGKASTIWSKDTGIDRNPADAVEVRRPDDQRERYLDADEISSLKVSLDEKMYRKAGKGINQTFFLLRLIVLIALVHLANAILALLPDIAGNPVSLQRLLGIVMAPICWLMGIPWEQAITAGSLMGIKTILNELIAYVELSKLPADALDARSRLIMLYAMCGFANFGSLGIMIAGLATMAPERRDDVVSLGFKSIVSGTLTTCLIGAIVGMLN